MSRVYIILLAIAALFVSSIGAVFSIFGLVVLFSGAPTSVGIMAASLEFAKLVTVGFLYRYWGHVNRLMRTYLSAAVVILSIITSMGIFGFLSNAYQKSALKLKTLEQKMAALTAEDKRIQEEIAKVDKFIGEIPNSRISKKFSIYEESRTHIANLSKKSEELMNQVNTLKLEGMELETEVGPIIYVAEALDVSVDSVVKILILVFVSVFDPLAICLVFAWSLAVRLREKYKGRDHKIAELAMDKPVDHRFKRFRKSS